MIGAPTIVVNGDIAHAFASVVAWHFITDPALRGHDLWLVGGCYQMTFDRIDGRWRNGE